MRSSKTLLGIAIISISFLFGASNLTAQTESLGAVRYSPPKGWARSAKDHAVVFSEIDQAKGNFCFITLYAATPSSGTPQQDFISEWKARVIDPWKGESNPKTQTEKVDGWTVIAGGGQIEFQGTQAFAFLNVQSGFGKTVSVLAILNDDSYLPPFQAFVESMDIDKKQTSIVSAATSSASAATFQRDDFGRIIIPLPTRQLTVADLAGQWGEAASFHQRYVYRSSGMYAGADSLTYKSKMTFTADGAYYNDFYAIQNGKMIKEKTAGSIAIDGRVLVIKDYNFRKYLIRGWLELPDMTVLEVNGPYYKDDVIPAEIFNNPAQAVNLNQQWVRMK